MRIIRDIAILLGMVLIQVYLLNEFLFFRYLNPYLYIYPLFSIVLGYQRGLQLLVAFALGASVDLLEGSGGMHSAASVFLAFILPFLYGLFKNNRDDNQDISGFQSLSLERKLGLLLIGFFIHHFALFALENFSSDAWLSLLKRSLYSSLFSFIFVLLYQLWNARR
jgi:rod shape-determining protein MreD